MGGSHGPGSWLNFEPSVEGSRRRLRVVAERIALCPGLSTNFFERLEEGLVVDTLGVEPGSAGAPLQPTLPAFPGFPSDLASFHNVSTSGFRFP